MILLALAATLWPAMSARAVTAVRIVETWPSGPDVTLGHSENFYLRLEYDSDKPVGIWVAPYFHGKPARAGSSPSSRYSGKGETIGWFFLFQPGEQVDEIRVTAGDGSTGNTPVVATWRGHVTGGAEAAGSQSRPEWVAALSARVKAMEDRARREERGKPVTVGDIALFNAFMLAVLVLTFLGFAAPAWGIWRWHGAWRLAAGVPAAIMAFVVLRIVFGVARDPTPHNLWPFEILMAGGLSAAVMAVLWLAHRFSGAGR